jgi:hypothetical protein
MNAWKWPSDMERYRFIQDALPADRPDGWIPWDIQKPKVGALCRFWNERLCIKWTGYVDVISDVAHPYLWWKLTGIERMKNGD